MIVKLIALAAIAAGVFGPDQAAIAEGDAFELDAEQAEKAISDGLAKVEDAGATAKASGANAKSVKVVKVRVLMDCEHGRPNDVVELPAAALKAAEAAGYVDGSAAAVAYASALPQNKPKR